MDNSALARCVMEQIQSPEALADFIRRVTGSFSRSDEDLMVGTALACSSEFWRSELVQRTLDGVYHANENLRLVFGLLACSSVTEEKADALNKLLRPENSHLLRSENLFRLLTSLHQRRIADIAEILLPRLHWYSNPGLWENAILTFRVCMPALLQESRLRRIASMKSARSRMLLRLFSLDLSCQFPDRHEQLRRTVVSLSRLRDSLHQSVIVGVAWVCRYEGPKLACAIAREMVHVGDHRDCEFLVPFLSDPRQSGDLDLLAAIAASPNAKAANWAKALLEGS